MSEQKVKTLASCFVILFFTIAVAQLAFSREDWPFSQFGMYSKKLHNHPLVSFQVDLFIFKDANWHKVRYRSLDWFHNFLNRNYKPDSFNIKNGFPEEIDKIIFEGALEMKEYYKAEKIRLRIAFLKWNHLNFHNRLDPDQYVLIKDQIY